MESKNLKAIGRGREYMLARFANLPMPSHPSRPSFVHSPQDGGEAKANKALARFTIEFGDLHPGINMSLYLSHLLNFRYHWKSKTRATRLGRQRTVVSLERRARGETEEAEMDNTSAWCSNILNRRAGNVGPPPVTEVDFPAGNIRVIPSTLLDWLVLQLIDCRRNLAICAREECEAPYFVKTPEHRRYCSETCYHSQRRADQEAWEEKNRANVARKRSAHGAPRRDKDRIARNAKTRRLVGRKPR